MKTASKIYAALVFLFLYAPIIVLIIFSFNSSSSTSVFSGFSLRWYESLFQDKATLRAFYNTIILAVTLSVIATVLGTAAAVGINKYKKGFMRSSVMAVTYSDDESRDSDGHLDDAALCVCRQTGQFGGRPRFWHAADSPCHIRPALYYPHRAAEVASNG